MTPEQAAREIESMATSLPKAVREMSLRAVTKAAEELKRSSPRDSGNLARSWRTGADRAGAILSNTARYSGFVEGVTDDAEQSVSKALDAEPFPKL